MSITLTDELLVDLATTHPTHDWYLQRLLKLTDMGAISIGLQISVVLGGRIIRGNLLAGRRFAQRVDHSLKQGVEESIPKLDPGSVEHEAMTSWRDGVDGTFEAGVDLAENTEEDERKRLEAIAEEKGVMLGDLRLVDLPEDLAMSNAANDPYRASLALEHAVMLTPPMNREDELGTIRVQIAQIEAWWLNGIGDNDPSDEEPSDPAQ